MEVRVGWRRWLTTCQALRLTYGLFMAGCRSEVNGDKDGQVCTVGDVRNLPEPNDPPTPPEKAGISRVNFVKLQYDFRPPLDATGSHLFNVYTQLVHDVLGESAYAFSIDDDAGLQKHPGEGMIFEIGGFGHSPLPNPNPIPPAVPAFYPWYTAGVSLGWNKDYPLRGWKKYGICRAAPDTDFPNVNPGTIGLKSENDACERCRPVHNIRGRHRQYNTSARDKTDEPRRSVAVPDLARVDKSRPRLKSDSLSEQERPLVHAPNQRNSASSCG